MKRVLVVVVLSMLLLSSCGMGWQNLKKDIKADIGGGLDRDIKVTNLFSGEEVWKYSGISYIKDSSSAGDVTIIYYDQGKTKKADFIGLLYGVSSIEK